MLFLLAFSVHFTNRLCILFWQQLLCEDTVGLRFSPVLYPKVSFNNDPDQTDPVGSCVYLPVCPQASQLIVSYDEHEVNNTFKFGVIYQKFGQVRTSCACLSKHIWPLTVKEARFGCDTADWSKKICLTCSTGVWGGAVQEQRRNAGFQGLPAAVRRHGRAAGLQGVRHGPFKDPPPPQ